MSVYVRVCKLSPAAICSRVVVDDWEDTLLRQLAHLYHTELESYVSGPKSRAFPAAIQFLLHGHRNIGMCDS